MLSTARFGIVHRSVSKATQWGIIRLVLPYSVKLREFTSGDKFKLAHENLFSLQGSPKTLRKERDIIFKSQKTRKNAQGTIFIGKRVTHELGKALNLTQFAGGFVSFFPPHWR